AHAGGLAAAATGGAAHGLGAAHAGGLAAAHRRAAFPLAPAAAAGSTVGLGRAAHAAAAFSLAAAARSPFGGSASGAARRRAACASLVLAGGAAFFLLGPAVVGDAVRDAGGTASHHRQEGDSAQGSDDIVEKAHARHGTPALNLPVWRPTVQTCQRLRTISARL